MGAVVKAWHVDLDQPVAIKVLMPEMLDREEIVNRFLREAKAAAKLKSQHIALVIDVGRLPDSTPVIVMEFLEGADLGAIVNHHGAQDPHIAVDLLLQACEGLAEAHSNGIIHRDVKSSNFFIIQKPNRPALLKVLDFGIATAPQGASDLTKTQSVMGTPSYMAPEQMRSSRDVDARSDIWSLGVVLYELLEGTRPFVSEVFSELCLKVGMDPPVPMVRQGVPPELTMVVMKCLEKGLERRYQTVADLAWDLIPFASDPGLARGTAERCSRMLGVTPSATRAWDGPGQSSGPFAPPMNAMTPAMQVVALPAFSGYVASPTPASHPSHLTPASQPSYAVQSSAMPEYARASSSMSPHSSLVASHAGRWVDSVPGVSLPTGPQVGGTPTSVNMGAGQLGVRATPSHRGWLSVGAAAAAAVAIAVGVFFAFATTDREQDSQPTSESAAPAAAGVGVGGNIEPATQPVPRAEPAVPAVPAVGESGLTTKPDASGSGSITTVAPPVVVGSGHAPAVLPQADGSGAAVAPLLPPVAVGSAGTGSASMVPTVPSLPPAVVAPASKPTPATPSVKAPKPVTAPGVVERKPVVVKKTDRKPSAPAPDDIFSKRK